jgi:hypothetical protein
MSDDNWLALPGDGHITGAAKLTKEKTRALNMGKKLMGKSRTWGSDGEYVWFRRKQANPATLQRHNKFVANGEYKHIFTSDDVEVYQLQPTSPFRRKEPVDLASMDNYNVQRQAALAACKRDWVTYLDALEELSGRIKGQLHPAQAQVVWGELLEALEHMIARRAGPTRAECDRELIAVRKRQGYGRERRILLPS